MKVGITKSRLYRGGVLQVVLGIADVLNEMGIVPDVLTLSSHVDDREIRRLYGKDIRLNIKRIGVNPRLPYEWHFLWFNLYSRRHTREYDLVIDSSNTSFLAGKSSRRLSYVHYPRKDRVRRPEKSIHVPEGPRKSFFDVAHDPFRLAAALYAFDRRSYDETDVIANSEFTKAAILRNFQLESDQIRVVYPPVDIGEPGRGQKNWRKVVSLGRFCDDKRQLEQLEIARRVPTHNFEILGFVSERSYFARCERFIADHRLSNARLIPNADFQRLRDALNGAGFFMHSVRDEPFGISTVQAIAAGCLPVVHDSGGQREIVPVDALRYTSVDEAVRILESHATADQTRPVIEQLRRHASRFGWDRFRAEMRDILREALASVASTATQWETG